MQHDLSPVEKQHFLKDCQLFCTTSTPLLWCPLILTLIAVDHIAKLPHIVFIDLQLFALYKCRDPTFNLREREREIR